MANRKKDESITKSMDTDEFITLWAKEARFSKSDIKIILTTMKNVIEEIISQGDTRIDLKGLFTIYIQDIVYKTPPGIVKFHKNKSFNNKTRRLIIKPALNLTDILRPDEKKKIKKSVSKETE